MDENMNPDINVNLQNVDQQENETPSVEDSIKELQSKFDKINREKSDTIKNLTAELEALKRKSMTKEQREAEDLKNKSLELENLKNELAYRDMLVAVEHSLVENELPTGLRVLFEKESDELTIEEKVNKLATVFKAELQKGIKDSIPAKTPGANSTEVQTKTINDIFKSKRRTK